MKLCELVKRVYALTSPVFCLRKERKSRDEISCVKFMFITCDKKVKTGNVFIYVL